MRTTWITGAGGLIGNYLAQTAPHFAPNDRLVALTRRDLDLTDANAVRLKFRQQKPSLVIHCAALAQTGACQAHPPLARKLNVEVTELLASLATDISMIFISTDLVFDGRLGNYDESAAPNPISVYAETKLEAEQLILANPRHMVVRTSLNAGVSPTGDRGFNEQICRAWRSGEALTLFDDEFRSPIPAEVTARAVWEIANLSTAGIYHVAGSERLSRWQIGHLLAARHAELNPRIKRSSLKGYQGPSRAPDTSLNCAKAQKLLSIPLPGFSAWLAANPKAPL